jgi:adenylate cyclase
MIFFCAKNLRKYLSQRCKLRLIFTGSCRFVIAQYGFSSVPHSDLGSPAAMCLDKGKQFTLLGLPTPVRILIVDDLPLGRQLISDVISLMGHEAIEAGDGHAGLAKARETPSPDLIVLDVNMPGMDGFEVCKILKSDPRTHSIPIIFLTSQGEPEDRIHGLNIGADDYLTKPFAIRELSARIDKRLQSRQATELLVRQQNEIRQTFERFVAPQIVEILLRDPTHLKLGGDLQSVTVMFTDLEGFTSLSEETPPDLLLSVLNRYHELVSNLVQKNGGIVNKFIGDGVMALFNTPILREDHAHSAVEAALAIREALPALHAEFEPRFRLPIKYGISTGPAIVGNVGASHCMDFTALGDTVNLAARLQSIATGGQIIISGDTRVQLGHSIVVSDMGLLTLRNRAKAITAHLVTGRS